MSATHAGPTSFCLLLLALCAVPSAVSAQEIVTETLPGSSSSTLEGPLSEGEAAPLIEPDEQEEIEQIAPGEVYTVTDIPVDVTAATTSAAREQAFAEGQRQGLVMLGEQLGLISFDQTVGRLSDTAVDQLVRSFSVAGERTLPGRYIADMTFVYEPDSIRRLLREGYVATEQTNAQDLVVLIPVYDPGQGAPRLWDPPNPWFDAWLNYDPASLSTEIFVPYGELRDVSDLPVQAALKPDTVAVARLGARYSAGRSVVAIARPLGPNLSISLTGISQNGQIVIDTLTVPLTSGQAGNSLDGGAKAGAMEAAVQQVAQAIDGPFFASVPFVAGSQQAPGSQQSTGTGRAASLTFAVPIEAPTDWYEISRGLRQIPMIVANALVSLSPREAIVHIEHLGSQEELRTALAARAFDLNDAGGVMELRRITP